MDEPVPDSVPDTLEARVNVEPVFIVNVCMSEALVRNKGPVGRGLRDDGGALPQLPKLPAGGGKIAGLRLRRIEGQVRGIARMIERGDYCIDILQQTAALRAAVDAVSLLLMEDHVAGCLATAVKTGDATAYTEEVMEVVRRSMGRPVRARPAD